jgi:aspartate-semialdehyde dehydrogenase
LIFSALDPGVPGEMIGRFAASGHHVFARAPSFVADPLIPLLVPGVNAQHVDLIEAQKKKRWEGAVLNVPGWSTVLLATSLAALGEFEVTRVTLTILAEQSAEDGENEEERVEREVQNVLGRLEGGSIEPSTVRTSAQAVYGATGFRHTELVSVEFARRAPIEQVSDAFRAFSATPQALHLPSAPPKPIVLHGESDSPCVSPEGARDGIMTVHVERLRRCTALDYKFVIHGVDRVLGSAAASILNAELVIARALLGRFGWER